MSLAWSKLVAIREEIPADELGVAFNSPLQDGTLAGESVATKDHFALRGWYRMGHHQFIRITLDGSRFQEFAWAGSAAALARSVTGDSFFDDGSTAQPPPELLADAVAPSIEALEKRAKEENPRHVYRWTDGRSRLLRIDRYEYLFRLEAAPALESPIAIRVRPKMHYLGHAECGHRDFAL